jgi:phosphate transport system substrate-binding protein
MGGTGSALAAMNMLAVAYHKAKPEAAIEILPSLGTSGGLRALQAGAIQIALSTRPLTEAERTSGLRDLPYARTPLAFAAHQESGITTISRDDLVRIYAGELTVWPGGTPVRLIRRPATEADWALLTSLSPSMGRAVQSALTRPGLVTAATDQDNAATLESVRGSFGLIALGQALAERRKLSLPTLEGTSPTPAAVASGQWPLTRSLYVVTKAAPPSEASAFLDFVFSREGRAILAEYGHLPAPGAQE